MQNFMCDQKLNKYVDHCILKQLSLMASMGENIQTNKQTTPKNKNE